jgi:hypothetical protein
VLYATSVLQSVLSTGGISGEKIIRFAASVSEGSRIDIARYDAVGTYSKKKQPAGIYIPAGCFFISELPT